MTIAEPSYPRDDVDVELESALFSVWQLLLPVREPCQRTGFGNAGCDCDCKPDRVLSRSAPLGDTFMLCPSQRNAFLTFRSSKQES